MHSKIKPFAGKRQKFSKAEKEDRWLEFLQRVYFSKSFTSTNFNTIDFSKIIGIPSGNLIVQLRENLGLSFIKCKIALRIYYAIQCQLLARTGGNGDGLCEQITAYFVLNYIGKPDTQPAQDVFDIGFQFVH